MNENREGRTNTIVFGAVDDPAKALSYTPFPAGRFLSPGIASVRPGDPALRLNSPGWLNLRPQMASELASHDDRIGWCEDVLTSHTPLFARPVQAFVANYIAFICKHIEDRRQNLDQKLVKAGLNAENGILNYKDWTFSAFLPLPNAYIALPNRDNVFLHVDCAFWTGQVLLAVVLDGLTMPRPSQAIALAELQTAGAEIRILRTRSTLKGDLSAFSGDLYDQLSGFAEHCTLPFGLFRLSRLCRSGGSKRIIDFH